MLNKKKYHTFKNVIVILIGLGLVMAYVPLIFVNKTADYNYPADAVAEPATTGTPVTDSVTTTISIPLAPQN